MKCQNCGITITDVPEDADFSERLCDHCEREFYDETEDDDDETFSTPCGSMTREEIHEHIKECGVCAAEHADIPLDL